MTDPLCRYWLLRSRSTVTADRAVLSEGKNISSTTNAEDGRTSVLVADESRLIADALVGLLQQAGFAATSNSSDEERDIRAFSVVVLDASAWDIISPEQRSTLKTAEAPRVVLVVRRPTRLHLELPTFAAAISRLEPFAELVRAIRAAATGAMPRRRIPAVSRMQPYARHSLTERERAVLNLLALGYANAAMATELSISVHTVRTHVQSVLAKLGAPNRAAAIVVAHREGVLGPHRGVSARGI